MILIPCFVKIIQLVQNLLEQNYVKRQNKKKYTYILLCILCATDLILYSENTRPNTKTVNLLLNYNLQFPVTVRDKGLQFCDLTFRVFYQHFSTSCLGYQHLF